MPFSIRLGSLISSFQFREDVVRSTLKDFKPEPPNGLPNLRIFCAGRTAYVGYAVTIAARMRCEQDFPLHARAVSQRALSSSLVVGAKTAAGFPVEIFAETAEVSQVLDRLGNSAAGGRSLQGQGLGGGFTHMLTSGL